MKKQKNCQKNEEGFVLIAALLILLVLTLMGIAVNRNTNIEWRIAMNDREHKETFYAADAATEMASEVLEQSIACLGFDSTSAITLAGGTGGKGVLIEPEAGGFWRQFSEATHIPSDADRDLLYPADADDDPDVHVPHANINLGGDSKLTTGAAIQMASGYEGTAKGIGSGGITLLYNINVQQIGRNGSESTICIQYGHILGQEGDCYYP